MAQAMIYGLADPRNSDIRYVGKTVQDPRVRLNCHLRECAETWKCRWVQGLKATGLRPVWKTLEAVHDDDDWQERERWWISWGKICKWPLTNLTDGGEGASPGHVHSAETRRKIRLANTGLRRSAETRARISKAKSGKNHPNYGKHRSIETRRRIGAAQKGRTFSRERRLVMSKALRRPFVDCEPTDTKATEKLGRDIRQRYAQGGITQAALGREYGLSQPTIGKIVNNKIWKYLPADTRPQSGNQGVGRPLAKLTERNVLDIRQRWARGDVLQKELANEYGLCQQTVSDIVNHKMWKHLTESETT